MNYGREETIQEDDYSLNYGLSFNTNGLDGVTKRDFWSLTSAIAMVGLSIGAILPLSSLRLTSWNISSSIIGIIISLHAIGLVCSIFLSDIVIKYGAKNSMKIFSMISILSCFSIQTLNTPILLGLGLFILGISLGVIFNTVETWVNEILPDEKRGRWIAIHCTIFTLFQLTGPLLIQILPSGYEFRICALIFLFAIPAFEFLSEHNLGSEEESDINKPWWIFLLNSPAILFSTALFALFDTVVLSLLPIYGMNQGLTQHMALFSASVVLFGDTSMEWVIGELSDKFGRVIIHWCCSIILLISAIFLPFTIGSLFWWIDLFILGAAAGGIYVLSMVACGQRFSGRSLLKMTSLLGSVWGAASIVGPLVTGLVMENNSKWSISLVVSAITLMLIISLIIEKNIYKK